MERNKNVLINFLDPKLLPKVSTKAAAMDNYEADNLISKNLVVKSRGFLAYTSIKPPIDVDFELVCAANIHYISLGTTIGTQKCIGVEILVKNNQGSYTSIAQSFYNESGVVFYNSRYYSKNNPPRNLNNSFNLAYFKNNTFRNFTNANSVRIRILKTDRSVPCLGSVEIWGRVSKSCSKVTCDTITRLNSVKSDVNEDESPKSTANGTAEFKIPDDFQDSLTYEMMAIPMTLPSGHTVDQSTIEKCAQSDARYGRHACDPFTGLPFTNNRRPLLNVALKSRIDMFLVTNSHRIETFTVARTSGTKHKLKNNTALCDGNKKVCLDNGIKLSLDETIAHVMKDKNFISFTNSNAVEDNKHECAKCKCESNLYVTSCQHFYCRNCVLNLTDTCEKCKANITKRDITKYR